MTLFVPRNHRIGRGHLAREGDTGAVVWATSRDDKAVSKGTLRAAVPARPGQMVFSDGVYVLGSGESLYPQDTAVICSGDTGANSLYAGRFLGKWPLQTSFAGTLGFDPVTAVELAPGESAFRTFGGKLCVSSRTGSPSSTYLVINPSGPWRSQAWTITGMGYTPSGYGGTNINLRLQSGGQTNVNRDTVSIRGQTSGVVRTTYNIGQEYDTWRHYAMTFDGRSGVLTTRTFLDGALVGTGTTPQSCVQITQSAVQVFTDGLSRPSVAYRNLRIYSKALSDAEIAAIAAEDAV